MTMSRQVLLAAIFSLLWVCALSCSCPVDTFSGRFGSSTVVLKARVVSVKTAPRTIMYTFQLLAMFKGCAPRKMFFGQSAATSCGVSLKKGRVYMLNLAREAGTKRSPFALDSCQGSVAFGRLNRKQKMFLTLQQLNQVLNDIFKNNEKKKCRK